MLTALKELRVPSAPSRRPARRATDPRRRRYLSGNQITGMFPVALCYVQYCSAKSGNPDLDGPCDTCSAHFLDTGCCDFETCSTGAPTADPSAMPTGAPTVTPTATPSDAPTATPSDAPIPLAELCAAAGFDVECTAKPSDAPTPKPTPEPTAKPSDAPSAKPASPTTAPTNLSQDAGEFGQGDGSFTEPDACSGLAKKTCKETAGCAYKKKTCFTSGGDACSGLAKKTCKYVPNKKKCKKAGCRWNKKKEKCLAKK